MKYKVGDVVKVREDLKVSASDGAVLVTVDMVEFAGKLVTIDSIDREYYHIEEDDLGHYWVDDFFEDDDELFKNEIVKHDDKKAQTVDIGYCLDYCGHRVIQNVYYGGYAHDHDHIFCTTVDGTNQYTLPVNSINFVIPHED